MKAQTAPLQQDVPGRLLIVEDDEPSRRLLRDIFAVHGYGVREAVDGEDALRAVDAEPPDVILLDVMMPKLDGVEVCRRLKASAKTSAIPVLLVTALHEREDRLNGIAGGANDFITKPFDADEVLLRVRNALCLKRAVDQRDRLLRLREDLSDMIVHDIRNPLMAIMLATRQIAEQKVPASTRALAKSVLGQVDLIERFIDDLIAVSQMEQASVKLALADTDLSELIQSVLAYHRQQAGQKHIILQFFAPYAACHAQADSKLIARLLDNLIVNAIKFSPDGGCVSIRLLPEDSGHPCRRIVVEDDGPGIPLHFRESIFDKYSVVEMSGAHVRQTGLGLTFCRLAAEAHGGRIYVTDRLPHGSAFVVELP